MLIPTSLLTDDGICWPFVYLFQILGLFSSFAHFKLGCHLLVVELY